MMDDDDWGLTAEQFDFLENDAYRKIASQGKSSSRLPRSPVTLPNNNVVQIDNTQTANLAEQRQQQQQQPKLLVKFVLHSSGLIAAKFSYHPLVVGAFQKIPKAIWNAKERLWMFPISSLPVTEGILKEIHGVNIQVQQLDKMVQCALHASLATPDLQGLYAKIPRVLQSTLLPFQRDGVRFILQHGGRAILADEMGLGKTLQAIAFASCVMDYWPVLILTPPSLRLDWASAIHQWLDITPSDILVVLSQHGGSNKKGFNIVNSSFKETIHLNGVFNILSYDAIPKLQDLILDSEFKVVIADESHYLKNAQAKRTSACLPILQKARYAILLSGTPALSRPIELFKQLEALYPSVYNSVHVYGNRYCKSGVFGKYQGSSNHDELHNLMKTTVMIRRLKKDVLSELPEKRRQKVPLNVNEKDLTEVKILFCELEVIKNKISACESSETLDSLVLLQKNTINKIYNSTAEAKIPAVLDYLSTVIQDGCKILIFAHHQTMIDSISQYLKKKKVDYIKIDGRTHSSLRPDLVTKFQNKENVKAAVLSIKASGLGLTLTAASTVIFAELSWTPGDIIQAEDRAHRIGQASSVNVHYLIANDTADDLIWDTIQNKLENLGQVLDGHQKSMDADRIASTGNTSKQQTLEPFLKRCRRTPE